jgi:hypothetical protein
MMTVPAGAQIWIAAGVTDLRRGFTGLSAMVQTKLEQDPFGGHVFVFRGCAAAALRPLLGSSKVQFLRITATIVLPGFSYDIVLNAGDECGLGWYEYQGAPRSVLLIRRAGESMIHFLLALRCCP